MISLSRTNHPDVSETDEWSARTVDGEILQTIEKLETPQSSVALGDIVEVVSLDGVPRDVIVAHVRQLQAHGEIYPVNGGFRIP